MTQFGTFQLPAASQQVEILSTSDYAREITLTSNVGGEVGGLILSMRQLASLSFGSVLVFDPNAHRPTLRFLLSEGKPLWAFAFAGATASFTATDLPRGVAAGPTQFIGEQIGTGLASGRGQPEQIILEGSKFAWDVTVANVSTMAVGGQGQLVFSTSPPSTSQDGFNAEDGFPSFRFTVEPGKPLWVTPFNDNAVPNWGAQFSLSMTPIHSESLR